MSGETTVTGPYLRAAYIGGTIPDIDHCGTLWFAAVGLRNGLSVLTARASAEKMSTAEETV
jgi:hypothetical protein